MVHMLLDAVIRESRYWIFDISTCSFLYDQNFFIRSKEVQSFATIKHCLIKYFITVSLAISMMNIFQLVSMPRILNYMLQWDCACYR